MSENEKFQISPDRASSDEWRRFLEQEYGASTTEEMAKLISFATKELYHEIKNGSDNTVLNTRHFYRSIVTETNFQLNNIQWAGGFESYFPNTDKDEYAADGIKWGDIQPSTVVHATLQKTSKYARSTSESTLTPWHFTVQLLSNAPRSFCAQFAADNLSIAYVRNRLYTNAQQYAPQLFKELHWPSVYLKTNKQETLEQPTNRSSGNNNITVGQAIDDINELWDKFLTNYQFQNDFRAALEKIKTYQIDLVDKMGAISFEIPKQQVSWQLSKEVIFYGILLYADETENSAVKLLYGINLPLAFRIQKGLHLSTGQIKQLMVKAFDDAKKANAASTKPEYKVAPIDLQSFFVKAQSLCKLAQSKQGINERHFIAAWLQLSGGKIQLGHISDNPAKLLYQSLEDHIKKDHAVESDDEQSWATILGNIKEHFITPDVGPPTSEAEIDDPQEEESSETKRRTNYAGKSSYGRNSESLGGDAKTYAAAIAHTFRNAAKGDFCFALFGRWGSGKTHLIETVAKRLRKQFQAITFNAWKYPSRPEIWVHLYETIKREANGSCWLNKYRLAVQINLQKDHGLPLLAAAFFIFLSVFPKSEWILASINLWPPLFDIIPEGAELNWSSIYRIGFSSMGIIALALYFLNAWKGFGGAMARYLKLPSHSGKLGLQAVIGDDLKRLLKTWEGVKWSGFIRNVKTHFGYTSGAVLMLVSLGVLIYHYHDTLEWLSILMLIIFVITFLSISIFLIFPIQKQEEVLLIIDDLDRCNSSEMLAVIEALRVLLDDKEVNERLSIAMLIDRRILSHAIRVQYQELLKDEGKNPEKTEFNIRAIIEEQIEKYFLVTFDMPPLDDKELRDIAEDILQYDRKRHEISINPPLDTVEGNKQETIVSEKEVNTPTTTATPALAASDIDPINVIPSNESNKPEAGNSKEDNGEIVPEPVKPSMDIELEDDEKRLLINGFERMNGTSREEITPRRIRMAMMRYFLARDLCFKLNVDFTPEDLIATMNDEAVPNNGKLLKIIEIVKGADKDPNSEKIETK